MKAEPKCGFVDVRPIEGHPGRYVCSACSKVMRDDWAPYLHANLRNEVNAREPISMPSEIGKE